MRRFLAAAPAFALAWALPEGLACGACGDAPGCVEDEEKTPSPSACGEVLLPESLPPLLPSGEPEATGPVGAREPAAEGSLLVAGDGRAVGFFGSSMTRSALSLDHMFLMWWPSAMSVGQRSYHCLTWSMWDVSTGETMGPSISVGWKA